MTLISTADQQACPYLQPKAPSSASFATYCRRPGGGVRVPSREELVTLCSGGHHFDCPGYRRTRLRETFSDEYN